MKQFILIFILLLGNISGYANTDPAELGTITGQVMDKELQEPIPYATITVTTPEGEMITGAVTSTDGTFSVEKLKDGIYIFKAQFMGYKTFSQEVKVSGGNRQIKIGAIYLEPEVAQLESVDVVAERSTIEQRIDRKVVNVGKDLTTTGASASEIMNNIPSLAVDQDGNISMRGNENVRILIDGKPTNIPAAQLLKQIPSTSIKSIELITNPSAKYNPEGMSGIINIILHKNSNMGFNGNLNTGVTLGENTRYTGSLDMNYRKGKLNFFGNFGTNGGKRGQTGVIQNFTNNYTEKIHFLNDNESYLFKVGVDYYLDDKNTFSFYTNQNYYLGEPFGEADIIFDDPAAENIYQDFFIENDNVTRTYNFVYNHEFNSEGHKLILEADHSTTDSEEIARFEYTGGGAENLDSYRDDVQEDISNTTFNLDYENPFSETAKLELGAEARLRRSANDYRTTNEMLDNALYDYDNNIYSFYSTFGQNWDKWSYQLGARIESYDVEAILDGDLVYETDYFTLYPSAFLSYKVNEMKTLQISYGRRVDRPGLNQVNPVREFSTPRITAVGNPVLDPQFTNSIELNYTHNFKKGSFTGGVFYRLIEDEINQVLLIDPEDPSRLLLTFMNWEDNTAYGAELSGRYKPFSWWSLNPSFELYSSTEKGFVGEDYLEVESTVYNFRLSQSFNVTKKLTLQLFGMYRSSSEMLQIQPEEFYFVNAGARYSFLNDKATLSLNINDIFDTQEFTFTTDVPYSQEGNFKGDSQTVYLGFSYRFGGGKNKALDRKQRDDNTNSGGGIF
ncbi:TonB-dependent receptor domain-containing protein [Salinimicrobium sp. TH3]|uniref:TonB-dependent receptor domain-containing protein n=1 Tax=Salinimicrobium sp. TH3 TaxID=2997342 RepID=UPI002275007B|nr:TonB-dependent receptor [Salinimicrobium sp. TH3]MCY2687445.1 TonB-dependent receptor [Salinimicrobium sp. TH3]